MLNTGSKLAMLLFVISTIGCNHIPMSTMLKMVNFDGKDFIALNPNDIRVKILVEGTKYIESNGAILKGVISYPEKDIPYNFVLETFEQKEVEIEGGFFSKNKDGTLAIYELGGSNIEQFQSLQKLIESKRRPKFSYDVSSTFSVNEQYNGNFKDIKLTISLMLKKKEGYLKVLDGVNFN